MKEERIKQRSLEWSAWRKRAAGPRHILKSGGDESDNHDGVGPNGFIFLFLKITYLLLLKIVYFKKDVPPYSHLQIIILIIMIWFFFLIYIYFMFFISTLSPQWCCSCFLVFYFRVINLLLLLLCKGNYKFLNKCFKIQFNPNIFKSFN